MTSSVNFSDISTPADLVSQNEQVVHPLRGALEAVAELNMSQSMALCVYMLRNVRDFHHDFATDKAEGRNQMAQWVYDEALVSGAITLLNRVDYGQNDNQSNDDTDSSDDSSDSSES